VQGRSPCKRISTKGHRTLVAAQDVSERRPGGDQVRSAAVGWAFGRVPPRRRCGVSVTQEAYAGAFAWSLPGERVQGRSPCKRISTRGDRSSSRRKTCPNVALADIRSDQLPSVGHPNTSQRGPIGAWRERHPRRRRRRIRRGAPLKKRGRGAGAQPCKRISSRGDRKSGAAQDVSERRPGEDQVRSAAIHCSSKPRRFATYHGGRIPPQQYPRIPAQVRSAR
jgi:hypothetical protein